MSLLTKNLRGMNATEVVAKVNFIEARMKDNPVYPDPIPELATIAAARESLEMAITAARDGGRTATAIRRARQRELILLINQLAGYVISIAEGNELAILSSGFDVRRSRKPSSEVDAPRNLQAMISPFKGRIDLRWKAVPGAVTYHIHMSATDPADDASWKMLGVSTRAGFIVKELVSARTYWFKVQAIGTLGVGPDSEVAHCMAT